MPPTFNSTISANGVTEINVTCEALPERDPIWNTQKVNYYTKIEVDTIISSIASPSSVIDNDPLLLAQATDKAPSQNAITQFIQSAITAALNSLLGPLLPNRAVFTDVNGALTTTGVVPVSQGGTGATTTAGAINAIIPPQFGNANKFLKTDGVNVIWSDNSDLSWSEESGSSTQLQANRGYVINYPTQMTLTLPTTSHLGDIIEITGKGLGGWILRQNSNQQISLEDTYTTIGTSGYIQPTSYGDCIRLICITPNTAWRIVSSIGNIELI